MYFKKQSIFIFSTIFISSIYLNCSQPQKKSDDQQVREKIEMEFKELKEEINSISIDDDNFRKKVEKFVVDFNEDMEDIKTDIQKNKKKVSQETKDLLNDAQSKSRKIQSDIRIWAQRTGKKADSGLEKAGDKLEEVEEEFKESWAGFKNWVDEKFER